MRLRQVLFSLVLLACCHAAVGQGFRFSEADDADRAEEAARADRIARDLSTPCRAALKDKKIMVVIGERRSDGYVIAEQQNYGAHFQAIDKRLRAIGLRTYTPEEIRKQIAQAEIDAYFRNDPDAALAAAKRLGASFVLRGLISSEASRHAVMAVNQVSVSMGFTLSASDGRIVSDRTASSSSYAGSDVQKMALTLVNENADEVVPALYADYCRNAGLAPAARPARK
jgi:hypothetical protein